VLVHLGVPGTLVAAGLAGLGAGLEDGADDGDIGVGAPQRTRPVVPQTSAQSRSVRMQRRRSATDSSLRQASAQAVHVWAHTRQASMHSARSCWSTATSAGELSIIALIVWVI
jgi:hypothetical protein